MIAAPVAELWAIIRDPHHLPRWWPRVTRVEDVADAAFTEVMKTKKGNTVRADFDVTHVDEAEHVVTWSQRIEGTPFAHVLSSAETELRIAPATAPADGAASEVTIELRQELVGFSMRLGRISGSSRFGGYMVRRAAVATIDEALDGLERISV